MAFCPGPGGAGERIEGRVSGWFRVFDLVYGDPEGERGAGEREEGRGERVQELGES